MQNKIGSTRLARGILVALIIILSFSALTFVVGNTHNTFFSQPVIAAGSSTNDPIATGNWQQDQYDSIIISESQSYGLSPFIVKGQIALESQFNTWAVSEVINSACAWTHDEGLMQVNPYCQQTGSANLFDPATNIYYGTQELASAYWQTGSIDLALQAYNIGLPNVLAGGRNWAYSSAVESYALQFENEHCAVYGCWTSTTTTTTTTSSSSSYSTYSASTSSSTSTSTSPDSYTQSSHSSSSSKETSKTNSSTQAIASAQGGGNYYNALRAHDSRTIQAFLQAVSSSRSSTQKTTRQASQVPSGLGVQNVTVNQNGTSPIPASNIAERATIVLYSIDVAFLLASILIQQKRVNLKRLPFNFDVLQKALSKTDSVMRLHQNCVKFFTDCRLSFRKWASEPL